MGQRLKRQTWLLGYRAEVAGHGLHVRGSGHEQLSWVVVRGNGQGSGVMLRGPGSGAMQSDVEGQQRQSWVRWLAVSQTGFSLVVQLYKGTACG